MLSLTYPCSWLFYFNQAHLHHLCILSPWLLFMLFYPFGNDTHHVQSANKIQLSLPRPTLPRVLPLILSSLPTQAVPLSFRHIGLGQLTSNIVDNRYYLLLILRSAWSLICHSKKLLVYHGRPDKKRDCLLLYKGLLNIERITIRINFVYIASSIHSYLKRLAYVKYLM